MGWYEIAGLTPLMVLIVLIGVLPGPFLDRLRPSTEPVIKKILTENEYAKHPSYIQEESEEGVEVFGESEEGSREYFAYPPPKEGTAPTGWLVSLSTNGKLVSRARYRAYAVCASS